VGRNAFFTIPLTQIVQSFLIECQILNALSTLLPLAPGSGQAWSASVDSGRLSPAQWRLEEHAG